MFHKEVPVACLFQIATNAPGHTRVLALQTCDSTKSLPFYLTYKAHPRPSEYKQVKESGRTTQHRSNMPAWRCL